VSRFVEAFAELQQLYGICPCCDEVFRLSDARLFVDAPPPKSPFDKVAEALRRLEAQVETFDAQEEALREQATLQGRRSAARRMRKLLPTLARKRVHPQDVKVLFSPVRYVAFPGMNEKEPRAIHFYDPPPETKAQEQLQRSLETALAAGNYAWLTLSVAADGTITEQS
jgi:predicted Holliday junction resolvase-like endonuclease